MLQAPTHGHSSHGPGMSLVPLPRIVLSPPPKYSRFKRGEWSSRLSIEAGEGQGVLILVLVRGFVDEIDTCLSGLPTLTLTIPWYPLEQIPSGPMLDSSDRQSTNHHAERSWLAGNGL